MDKIIRVGNMNKQGHFCQFLCSPDVKKSHKRAKISTHLTSSIKHNQQITFFEKWESS